MQSLTTAQVFSRSLGTALWDQKDADLSRRQHTVLGVHYAEERSRSGAHLEEQWPLHWVPLTVRAAYSLFLKEPACRWEGLASATLGYVGL